MECSLCKKKNFYKNDSGFFVCLNCFSQYNAPKLKVENTTSGNRTLKKKLKMNKRIKKVKKKSKQ